MGGRFRMVYSFSREVLAETVTKESDQTDCLNMEGSVSLGLSVFASLEGSGQYAKCEAMQAGSTTAASFSSRREEVRGIIEGGEASKVGKLQGGIIFSRTQPDGLKSDYDAWVQTICERWPGCGVCVSRRC